MFRRALFLVLAIAFSAAAQTKPAPSKSPAPAAPARPAAAFPNAALPENAPLLTKVESYLRVLFAWGPDYQVKLGPATQAQISDLYKIPVQVTHQGHTKPEPSKAPGNWNGLCLKGRPLYVPRRNPRSFAGPFRCQSSQVTSVRFAVDWPDRCQSRRCGVQRLRMPPLPGALYHSQNGRAGIPASPLRFQEFPPYRNSSLGYDRRYRCPLRFSV